MLSTEFPSRAVCWLGLQEFPSRCLSWRTFPEPEKATGRSVGFPMVVVQNRVSVGEGAILRGSPHAGHCCALLLFSPRVVRLSKVTAFVLQHLQGFFKRGIRKPGVTPKPPAPAPCQGGKGQGQATDSSPQIFSPRTHFLKRHLDLRLSRKKLLLLDLHVFPSPCQQQKTLHLALPAKPNLLP